MFKWVKLNYFKKITMKWVYLWYPSKKVSRPKKNFFYIFSCKEWNYLFNVKERTCISFFLLKIFEFYFCPGNYASLVVMFITCTAQSGILICIKRTVILNSIAYELNWNALVCTGAVIRFGHIQTAFDFEEKNQIREWNVEFSF